MSIAMVLSYMPSIVFAESEIKTMDTSMEFMDMPQEGFWSTQALREAVNNGLLNGFVEKDGSYIRPNDPLTRAQLATVVNRAFGANETISIQGAKDVTQGLWYYKDIEKAVKMGTLKLAENMRPNDNVTRQEAFTILGRALKMDDGSRSDLLMFGDSSKVSDWAVSGMGSMVKAGYIKGDNNLLAPTANMTRAQFAVIINNLIKEYIKTPGVINKVASGNIMVNVPDVTLEGVTISGDLIIGDGVGDGTVTLKDVEVQGNLIARGGGVDSIIIAGNSVLGKIIVAKVNGKIRIFVEDGAVVKTIEVDDGKDEVIIEGEVGTLEIESSNTPIIVRNATIAKIEVNTQGTSNINLDKNSKVDRLIIGSSATETKVEVEGSINNFETAAPNTVLLGRGTVTDAKVKDGADGTSITTPNTTITNGGAVRVTGGGGDAVKENTTEKNNNTGTEIINQPSTGGTSSGGGSSSSGGSSVVAVSAITVSPTTMDLTVGGGAGTIVATVSPDTATNKNVTWASSNNAVATVANGVVTPVTAGTITITAKTVDGGFAKTISVTVKAAPVTLNSIAIITPATKTIYTVGETFDITGLVVTGTYSDASTKAETITVANVTGFNSAAAAASQTLTITVGGKTTSYVISIVKKTGPILTGVTADNTANTITGMTAAMEFSVDGAKWEEYNETTPNLPDLTGDVYLQVRFASTDTHEAGAATTFNFTAATLESIAIKTPATKLVYKAGEALDITGLVIEGTYSDESKKNVAITAANVSGFDSTTVVASQTLTVTVDGKTTTYTVEIQAATLSSIAIKTPATKLVYKVGETLDITGLVIEGTYSDGSKKDETITAANVTGFNSSAVVASQTLTVTVNGKTVTYKVEIKAATLETIAVKTPASKLVYTLGETLDIAGLVIEGTYSDGSKKDETITDANVSGFDSSAVVASQTLTVTVDGKTTTYTVEIKPAATLSSIEVKTPATKLVYAVGETLDIAGLVIEGTYSDLSKRIVSITSSNVSGFDSSAVVASQTLTVTVDGKTTTYTIEIQAVPVTSVTLSQATMNLKIGAGTGTLKATIVPANASNKNVTWSSSAPTVATVVNGVVTPLTTGTATITVTTADGSKTATCIVTVTAANIATKVSVNGGKILQSGLQYLVNGERAETGTLGSGGCTAYFDLATGILTLHNYDGANILAEGVGAKDLIIKLIGTNKVTGTTTGIENPADGDIYITADSDATLEVITSASQDSYAISSQYDSSGTKGSVVIGGKAKVTVSATSDTKQAIGIFAREDVSIQEDAYFTAAINAKVEMDGYGILAKKSLTINTTGDISIDCSQSQKGVCLYSTLDLNHVNLMTLKAPTSGGFIFGSPDLSGVAVNINTATKQASYRSGMPYKLEVLNGVIDSTSVLGGVSDSSGTHQALENDEIIIKADTIDLFTFDKWTNEDGSELSPSIFTMVNAATGEAKIKMPAGNLNIKANYKSMLFTEQPQFHRGDMKITWNIKSAANSGSLQRKTVETWSDWKTIDIAIGAGTRSINNSSGDTTKYAPDGTYRLKFVLNSGDAGFQEHYSDEFEILWDAQLEGTVAITGTPMFGETLTANATITSTEPGELKYQWFADTDEISGATNQTLVLAEEQIGKTIKVEVSSHNYNLPITNEAGPVTKATAPAAPIVVGTAFTPADEILVVGEVERIIVTIGANMTGVYEYSVDSGSIWSQLAAGYINGLTSATTSIQIRVKETTTTETGAVATQAVTVTDMIVVADKTVLTTAISEANTNKGTAVVSTDGSDVLPANKWVTLAEMTAYTTAIATAQGVAENTSATQTEVNSAVTVLATATSTFDTAKKAGTKVALDTTPPVITATDKIVPIANLAAWTETVSATDDVNGNITSNVVATYFQSDGSTSLTDLAAAKTYIGDATTNISFVIKYNVSDVAGNAATEVVVTITVTKANVPDSISVGGKTLNSTNPYLIADNPASTGTLGGDNCTAHFDPITGVLSLQGYDGETIQNMTPDKALNIKLIGDDNKITGGQFGIYNYSGDIHITSDSEASLEINQNGSSGSATIVTGWGGQGTGSVIISGKAKVKALGITTNGFMNGIQARKDVIIQNEASFDATLKATSNTAWGIYANNIIIDTVGNIDINISNSVNGYGIYGSNVIKISKVNSMLITIPSTGVASTTNFTTGTVDVLSGVAVNKSTTVASYRSGTPYTLGLEGGNITLATGEVIGSPHQYLVYDEITIQSTISESNFDRWTKADGTELIGSLFTGSTTANSATATIKMPAESLSIKAKVKDTVIDIAAITGVTAPVTGATPLTTPIETAQYTGTVAWSGSPATFAGDTVYTATITLTPKAGYTLTGVAENFFTVDGATTVTNAANTGVVAAVFAKTVALSNDAALTSSIGTVDNTANTIVDVPYATTLEVFKAAITPATGATFKVYQADGTTEATDLASGYKVIVTAQDTTTTKTYTVTVEIGDFAGGLGTVGSPYQVSNAEQLNKVRDYKHQRLYFTQTANIDLTSYLASDGAGYNGGKGWVPIGSSETGSEFKGNYDGANYTITGLTIVSSEDYQGLFGNGAQYTNLKNIKLSGVNIKGNSYVGGLIGKFGFGQLENCHVSGKVEGTGDFVGGLAGLYNNSEIGEGMKNCSTSVEVIGNKHVGGLAGYSGYTTIDSCYSKGSVKGVENVGGLVGYMSSAERVKVSNSYSLASVTGTGTGNKPVGGLVGYNNKAIENCYAVGLVTGTGTGTYVGGLVGTNESTVTSSYYDSTTTTQSDTGKGVGKITTDMKQAATFAGWDTSIWNIADGSYPTLKWQE